MIKVNKDFFDIPEILKSKNRKEAFLKNIKDGSFSHGKTLYKNDTIKKKLRNIYSDKCAYCEKDISDDPQAIEHYRPKDKYYWLAYSWDNLLLSCTRCNSKKFNNFKVKNSNAIYNNESFEDIHNL